MAVIKVCRIKTILYASLLVTTASLANASDLRPNDVNCQNGPLTNGAGLQSGLKSLCFFDLNKDDFNYIVSGANVNLYCGLLGQIVAVPGTQVSQAMRKYQQSLATAVERSCVDGIAKSIAPFSNCSAVGVMVTADANEQKTDVQFKVVNCHP